MKILVLIPFLLLFFGGATAQQPYAWQLTDEDGLPTMVIYDLFQDSKGYMWFGTEAGICKYNGIRTQTYSHPKQKGSSVTRIMEDAQGRIWYKNFSGQLFFIENDSLQLFVLPDDLELSSYFLYHFFDKNAAQPIKITDLKNEKGEGVGTKVEVWIPIQLKIEN